MNYEKFKTSWLRVFPALPELCEPAFKCSDGELILHDVFSKWISGFTSSDRTYFSDVFKVIRTRRFGPEISSLLSKLDPKLLREPAVSGLSCLYRTLKELETLGYDAFRGVRLAFDEVKPESVFDVGKLPPDLRYLADAAARYGKIRFDSQINEFVQSASEDQIEELSALGEKIRIQGDETKILEWCEISCATAPHEKDYIYNLLGLIDSI